MSDNPTWNRKDLLKLALPATAGALIGAYDKTHRLTKFVEKLRYPYSSIPDVAMSIATEGQSLDFSYEKRTWSLDAKDLPIENPNWRPVTEIIEEGIRFYKSWRSHDPSLPAPKYIPPPNYITTTDIISPNPLVNLNDRDQPGFKISGFSQINYTSLRTFLDFDPGSGFRQRIINEVKTKHGLDLANTSFPSEYLEKNQNTVINCIDHDFRMAGKNMRDFSIDGHRISTSYPFAYFLFLNKGLITNSLFDTTIYLKVLARSHIPNISILSYEEELIAAKKLELMFTDEFSERVSFNWVAKNVPKQDERRIMRMLTKGSDIFNVFPYLNLYLPNRIAIYHPWNLAALSTCMSPSVLKIINAGYYVAEKVPGSFIYQFQGSEKTLTDYRVAGGGDALQKIWNRYL